MTARRGLFVAPDADGTGTSAQDARLALAGLVTGVGLLSGLTVTGSSSGPNMQYVVATGVLLTARGTAAADGLYLWANDGPVTVNSGAPAPGSGSRWDLVWARPRNVGDGFADPTGLPIFGVTVGTSGATPTKPTASVPAGALVLAESLVEAGDANATAATITNVAVAAGVRGGILRTSGVSAYPASPSTGDYIDDATLGLMRWNGSAWRHVPIAGEADEFESVSPGGNTDVTTTSPTTLASVTLARPSWASVAIVTGSYLGIYETGGSGGSWHLNMTLGTTTPGSTDVPLTGLGSGVRFAVGTFSDKFTGVTGSPLLRFRAYKGASGATLRADSQSVFTAAVRWLP